MKLCGASGWGRYEEIEDGRWHDIWNATKGSDICFDLGIGVCFDLRGASFIFQRNSLDLHGGMIIINL